MKTANVPERNSGYTILESTRGVGGDADVSIALAYQRRVVLDRQQINQPEYVIEYVTWTFSHNNGSFFWGHYHSNVVDAANDYRDRVAGIAGRKAQPWHRRPGRTNDAKLAEMQRRYGRNDRDDVEYDDEREEKVSAAVERVVADLLKK